MIYLFSDQANSKHGYGAFVPREGNEYFETTAANTFDLTAYASSATFRLGSKSDGTSPASLLR